jgi:hypothetical protein
MDETHEAEVDWVAIAMEGTIHGALQIVQINSEVSGEHVAGAGGQNTEGHPVTELVDAKCFDNFTDGAIAARDQ